MRISKKTAIKMAEFILDGDLCDVAQIDGYMIKKEMEPLDVGLDPIEDREEALKLIAESIMSEPEAWDIVKAPKKVVKNGN